MGYHPNTFPISTTKSLRRINNVMNHWSEATSMLQIPAALHHKFQGRLRYGKGGKGGSSIISFGAEKHRGIRQLAPQTRCQVWLVVCHMAGSPCPLDASSTFIDPNPFITLCQSFIVRTNANRNQLIQSSHHPTIPSIPSIRPTKPPSHRIQG